MSKQNREYQFLVFRIGKEYYAVDVVQVKEIVKLREITRIPQSPPHVRGVMNLRGHVVVVVDAGMLLGTGESSLSKASKIIIIETSLDDTIGVIVDEVLGVISVHESAIEKVSSIVEGSQIVKGLIKKDDKLISIIDLREVIEKNISTQT